MDSILWTAGPAYAVRHFLLLAPCPLYYCFDEYSTGIENRKNNHKLHFVSKIHGLLIRGIYWMLFAHRRFAILLLYVSQQLREYYCVWWVTHHLLASLVFVSTKSLFLSSIFTSSGGCGDMLCYYCVFLFLFLLYFLLFLQTYLSTIMLVRTIIILILILLVLCYYCCVEYTVL